MNELETRLTALEAQVRQLTDCEAIRQILARYGPLADSANNDARRLKAGALFADKGVYDLGDNWSATGPEAIGELLNDPQHIELIAKGSAHVMGLPYITLQGDSASALSYSRVYRHEDGEFTVWRVSINYWQLVRSVGDWKVMRRTTRLLNGSDEAYALLLKVDIEPDSDVTE